MTFELICNKFDARKEIVKCCVRNCNHFISASYGRELRNIPFSIPIVLALNERNMGYKRAMC